MTVVLVHTGLDALAWIAAALSLYWLTRVAAVKFPSLPARDWHYIAVLVFGAGIGAVFAWRRCHNRH
jgi:hypothetical protein